MASPESGTPLFYEVVVTVTSKGYAPATGKYNVNLVEAGGQQKSSPGFYDSTNMQLTGLSETDSDEFEISKSYRIKFFKV